jgi:hypothetical protein
MKKPKTNDIFAAWLLDRAEQYSESSCCRAVFDELINGAQQGLAQEDYEHGDLDDILKRWGFEVPR